MEDPRLAQIRDLCDESRSIVRTAEVLAILDAPPVDATPPQTIENGLQDLRGPLELDVGRQSALLVAEHERRIGRFLAQAAVERHLSLEQLARWYALASEISYGQDGALTIRWWLEPIPARPAPPA